MHDPTVPTASGPAATSGSSGAPAEAGHSLVRMTRHSVSAWLAALLAASLLLSACSAIGPQPVSNPLGLHGQNVDVVFPGALGVLAVPGEGGGSFTFADVEFGVPIKPGALTNAVGIASAVLSGATGPDTITITDPQLTVRIWHGAPSYDLAPEGGRATVSVSSTATIVLARGTCFASSCSYHYQSGPRSLGDLKLSGAELSAAFSVMTQEPSPNQGTAELALQADPDELAGRTLTIKLDAAEGELRF